MNMYLHCVNDSKVCYRLLPVSSRNCFYSYYEDGKWIFHVSIMEVDKAWKMLSVAMLRGELGPVTHMKVKVLMIKNFLKSLQAPPSFS